MIDDYTLWFGIPAYLYFLALPFAWVAAILVIGAIATRQPRNHNDGGII